jgi:DNA-binding LacI/PurR family transcriptional regulator
MPIDSLSMDNTRAADGYRASDRAGSSGIAFLSGPIRTVNRLERLDGYRRALSHAKIEWDASLIWEKALESDFGDTEGVELGRRGAQELCRATQRPTALVAINDMYALGAYAGIRDLGLRVPDDLSIVGIDDIVLAQVVDPPLTTIRQPMDEMAATAVDTIIRRLKNKSNDAPQHMTFAPELVVRKSLQD